MDGPVISRRDFLGLCGATGTVLAAAGCAPGAVRPLARAGSATPATPEASPAAPSASATPAPTPATCVLSPELIDGPYYLSGEAVRSDITEDRPGLPLVLALRVVDAASCAPIAGAAVDLWHADAAGDYSGFGMDSGGATYLRGVQLTAADGSATFTSIYPGWYTGRAAHIHVKVHIDAGVVHTGQLFLDDAVTAAVYAQAPYSAHRGQRVSNAADPYYQQNGAGALSLLTLTPSVTGYTGAATLGVRRA